jgi:hypothetical protein
MSAGAAHASPEKPDPGRSVQIRSSWTIEQAEWSLSAGKPAPLP